MQSRLLNTDGYCFVCGGNGFSAKTCPSCGRKPNKSSLNFEFREDTEKFVQQINAFGIPDVYRGVVWDKDILLKNKRNKANDYSFQRFVAQLDKINTMFSSGLLPGKSAIIIAPAGYSKTLFAYSCMQHAVDHDFTIAPMLDTVELKRLLVLAAENPTYKLYGKISYDDYIMSDVLFVTVTKLKQHEWAYETIQEILDRRSRKGLSTFVISRYNLAEMSRRDYSNQFDALATATRDSTYKYPAVVLYDEMFTGGAQ